MSLTMSPQRTEFEIALAALGDRYPIRLNIRNFVRSR